MRLYMKEGWKSEKARVKANVQPIKITACKTPQDAAKEEATEILEVEKFSITMHYVIFFFFFSGGSQRI